jgi:hypothetical protein
VALTHQTTSFSRRRLLGAAAGGAAAVAAVSLLGSAPAAASDQTPPKHLSWVWQFNDDGDPGQIRSVLADHGLGVIVKTHDGKTWMGKWDTSHMAIHGGSQVRAAASFFEEAGVPFHAWCVVKGNDPVGEAQMCAEVLANGARSLIFDLEPNENGHYWQGSPDDALAFGRELRSMWPDAWLAVAPDPRPWQLKAVPIGEFASFCNEIAPQTYWDLFNTSANHRLLREYGHPPGPEGVTPESVLDVTRSALGGYNLPIRPIGSGKADRGSWERFVNHAYSLGMETVSIWRYGTCNPDVLSLLNEKRPQEKHEEEQEQNDQQEEHEQQQEEEKEEEPQVKRPRRLTQGVFGNRLNDPSPPVTKAKNNGSKGSKTETTSIGTGNKLMMKSLFHWTKGLVP